MPCTRCKVLYVGNYPNLSFGPFAEVCCCIMEVFKLLMHWYPFSPIFTYLYPFSPTCHTSRSGRQKAATRRNMRREERVTVQGPVKEQQPDGMSHRGAGMHEKGRGLRGG